MMHVGSADCRRLFFVRLNPGDDVLASLRAVAEDNSIEQGMILNGAGSLSRYHVHVVETTNLPPGDVFFEGEGPFDVISLTGFIMDGRVHAHITFSDTEKAMGGHLEEGCRVLTFCLIAIADVAGIDLTDWDRTGPL